MEPKTKRRRRTRRLAVLASIAVITALVLLADSGFSQSNQALDANRKCGERAGCDASEDCWMHHRGEGMRDAFILVPVLPQQVKRGEPAEAQVQIISPWKNHLQGFTMQVNMLAEEGERPVMAVPGAAVGGSGPEDTVYAFEGVYRYDSVDPPTVNRTFLVETGVSAIIANLHLEYNRPTPLHTGGVDARIVGPSQSIGNDFQPSDPTAEERNVTIEGDDLSTAGTGNFSFLMDWAAEGSQNIGMSVRWSLDVTVLYGGGGGGGEATTTYEIPRAQAIQRINPSSSEIVPFTIQGHTTGTQRVEIQVRADVFYEAGHKDGVTPDFDNYTRVAILDVVVGDSFVASANAIADVQAAGEDVRLVVGEITGFAGAILLIPSIFLGGTFGRDSRKFFNALLRGAKRRVMFHNLVSLGLTVTAAVHIVMFLLEIRYSLAMGVLWGGLGALSLMVLGLTGYYQVPLIQRFGYKVWRYTHLAFGLLVAVFVAYHTIADGPDFFFIKEQLPDWLNRINLAEK